MSKELIDRVQTLEGKILNYYQLLRHNAIDNTASTFKHYFNLSSKRKGEV